MGFCPCKTVHNTNVTNFVKVGIELLNTQAQKLTTVTQDISLNAMDIPFVMLPTEVMTHLPSGFRWSLLRVSNVQYLLRCARRTEGTSHFNFPV